MQNSVTERDSSVNALFGERPSMRGLKETNGRPKHTTRLTVVNAGSPTSREAHGDGVPIVVKCSGQCLRHGEGEQVLLSNER